MKKIFYVVLCCMFMIGYAPIDINAQNLSKGHYLVIDSKTNKMGYFKDGYLVKEFSVGTGKVGSQTPKGKFQIVNKIKNRPYYFGGIPGGDPKNPLGDRWLGLHVGATYGTTYAIHGTNQESSIGGNVSAGCVRMFNNDIRWLFDQVPKGSYAIIYDGDETYSEIANKYGIILSIKKPLNEKQNDALNKFNNFVIYGSKDNPIVNLNDKNSVIPTLYVSEDILRMNINSQKSKRAIFLDAWNVLSKEEISHEEISFIQNDYNNIISVLEASKGVNAFYEKVCAYANHILDEPSKVITLNDINNEEFGARGYAKKMYDNVVNTFAENETNSLRMKDLLDKYNDAVNFLEIAKNIQDKDINSAKEKVSRLRNRILIDVANNAIDLYSDIEGHWAFENINNAMNNNWVDTTKNFKPNEFITRAQFVKIINRALNYTESEDVLFTDIDKDAWYYNEVCIAVKNGYIGGYDDNTFKPDEFMTREDVASIISKIKEIYDTEIDKINNYNDAYEVAEWVQSSLEGCIENGYLNGYSDNTLRPKNNITRAESIVIIERIIN